MNKAEYISEKIITRISTVQLRSDGILYIEIRADEEFGIGDMNELMAAAKKIGGGRKFRNLVVVGSNTLPDKEARELSTSEEGSIYKIADAFVIHSLAQAIMGNFYIKINKPYVPTHFFKNIPDAIKWLKQFERA